MSVLTLCFSRADPNPTAPGPDAVFNEGSQCTINWSADSSGTWKTMNIQLMTSTWSLSQVCTYFRLFDLRLTILVKQLWPLLTVPPQPRTRGLAPKSLPILLSTFTSSHPLHRPTHSGPRVLPSQMPTVTPHPLPNKLNRAQGPKFPGEPEP